MREGHIGKAQEKIRAGKDIFVQSEGPADNEIDGACAGHHQAVYLLGKRHTIQLFAFNGEHDAVFSVPNMGKKPLSLPVSSLWSENGEELETANHAQMTVWLPCAEPVASGLFLRRRIAEVTP